jgi:hypothetical protein
LGAEFLALSAKYRKSQAKLNTDDGVRSRKLANGKFERTNTTKSSMDGTSSNTPYQQLNDSKRSDSSSGTTGGNDGGGRGVELTPIRDSSPTIAGPTHSSNNGGVNSNNNSNSGTASGATSMKTSLLSSSDTAIVNGDSSDTSMITSIPVVAPLFVPQMEDDINGMSRRNRSTIDMSAAFVPHNTDAVAAQPQVSLFVASSTSSLPISTTEVHAPVVSVSSSSPSLSSSVAPLLFIPAPLPPPPEPPVAPAPPSPVPSGTAGVAPPSPLIVSNVVVAAAPLTPETPPTPLIASFASLSGGVTPPHGSGAVVLTPSAVFLPPLTLVTSSSGDVSTLTPTTSLIGYMPSPSSAAQLAASPIAGEYASHHSSTPALAPGPHDTQLQQQAAQQQKQQQPAMPSSPLATLGATSVTINDGIQFTHSIEKPFF